jgi:DNA-binding response OmpR family regulator
MTSDNAPAAALQPATVLLYSDDPKVRDTMRLAIGTRPAADLLVKFVEASTQGEVIRLVDNTDIDLLVLDGEAAPSGGLGIARQLKDEIDDCPPTCVVIARAADRWLAAYARVDATLTHPLDPMTTGQTVASMLRNRAAGVPSLR